MARAGGVVQHLVGPLAISLVGRSLTAEALVCAGMGFWGSNSVQSSPAFVLGRSESPRRADPSLILTVLSTAMPPGD